MEDEIGTAETTEAAPAAIAGEGSEATAEAGAVAPNPGAAPETADKNITGGDKQSITTDDPFSAVKTALGEVKAGGKPLEFKDLEHIKRMIQQGVGAEQAAAQYNAKSGAYKWLNEQLADEGNKALFTEFKADPGLIKFYAGLNANAETRQLLDHMRFNSGLLPQMTKWIREWEENGSLDRGTIELGRLALERDGLKGQLGDIATSKKQEQARMAAEAEKTELFSKLDEFNGGIPFTQAQLGAIQVMRDGMRLQEGYAGVTYAQALAELKEQGLWAPARKNPGPGAPQAGNPQARAPNAGAATVSPAAYKAQLLNALG